METNRDPIALPSIDAWLAPYGPFAPDETLAVAPELAAGVLGELAGRLSSDNYPFGHPVYAGQMLKPPHPVAMAAYALAMRVNPNNHALDGGPATAAMEREVVADLMRMARYDPATSLGHLTSSGTIANLEALWVARELADEGRLPGRAVAGSASAHYTHARMCQVLGVPFVPIATGPDGRMNLAALDAALATGDGQVRIGTVVATAGTTSLGAVDPVDAIVARCRAAGVRVHLDAAYGGFFRLLADGERTDDAGMGGDDPDREGIGDDSGGDGGGSDPADGDGTDGGSANNALAGGCPVGGGPEGGSGLPPAVAAAFRAMGECDSIVIDPHKHGLQPYGCGAVLFRDAGVGRLYAHDSPYTYFTSDELHLGEISLECSRAGASAAALWATLRCLPLKTNAGLGPILAKTRSAALAWAGLIADHPRMRLVTPPDLDIVCWYPLPAAGRPATDGPVPATRDRRVSAISAETRRVFAAGMRPTQDPARDAFFLATLTMTPGDLTAAKHADLVWDEDRLTVLRSVLMKPEHAAFAGELHRRVAAALG